MLQVNGRRKAFRLPTQLTEGRGLVNDRPKVLSQFLIKHLMPFPEALANGKRGQDKSETELLWTIK